MSRLKDKYLSEVVKGLQEKYSYKNVMQIPKVTKVVINMAVGEAVTNSKALDAAVSDMTIILVRNRSSRKLRNPSQLSKSVKA